MPINVTFLRDLDNGGSAAQPAQVATQLAEFISAAKSSLHIAIYDFRLKQPQLADPVINALNDRAEVGVEVQISFDHGKPDAKTIDPFITDGADPAPKGTKTFLEGLFKDSKVQIESIAGSKLMHNKYIIRDVHTPDAMLWTGSANFTDDAWTFQDNNILQIASPQLCSFYETDFQELWVSGNIRSTGVNDTGTVSVESNNVDIAFAPGHSRCGR
jgi:phosphatidylserine/phosphatidylglycerophosphate/cardiolipin synthase-like enzyme